MGSACTVQYHQQDDLDYEGPIAPSMWCTADPQQAIWQTQQIREDQLDSPREMRRMCNGSNVAADLNNQLIDGTSTANINNATEFSQYLKKYEVDLSSPQYWNEQYDVSAQLATAAKQQKLFADPLTFDNNTQQFTETNNTSGRTFENLLPEQTRKPRVSIENMSQGSGVCDSVDDEDFIENGGIDLDDPQYLQAKESRTSILSQQMDRGPFYFRLEDWKREDESEHNFSKLVLQLKYMCSQMEEHAIEYDVWVDMLLEWSKNMKHLGKGMQVACKDFESRAWYLTNNRELLVKHGVINKGDKEYKYLMDFIQLEIELGVHRANVTNNESELKAAVQHCKGMSGPRKITQAIADDLKKNQYCGTCRTVLRAAWFFELQENIYYNFCTYREDEMYVIGRKCYNKYLAPKHNWVYKKICNWALKLLIKRKLYTDSFIEEQSRIHDRVYTEDDLIEEMWEAHPYVQRFSEYIWAYYRDRGMDDLP